MAPTGEQESHGETGFGLVNPSLRIFRLATLIGSSFSLQAWSFNT